MFERLKKNVYELNIIKCIPQLSDFFNVSHLVLNKNVKKIETIKVFRVLTILYMHRNFVSKI